jgi:type IV secretory pathway component VirB8
MLVGDQQMTRQQVTRVLHKKSSRWPSAIVVGWIILVLAVLAIIILLYLEKFQPASSGLKLGVQ